ncbi:NF-kappa-B inhibitor-interacting Ras-like protein 2, partial [Leptotrombidium deliense]
TMLRTSSFTVAKTNKVYVFGAKGCGKTSLIRDCLFGNRICFRPLKAHEETIEDIYSAVVEYKCENKCAKERVNFFDTSGLWLNFNSDYIKHYISYADGIIIVYAINDRESFQIAEQIKKAIDRLKEKKEIPIICFGNKSDKYRDRVVKYDDAQNWAHKERIKLYEVAMSDRKTIMEAVVHLTSAMNPPQSKFTMY